MTRCTVPSGISRLLLANDNWGSISIIKSSYASFLSVCLVMLCHGLRGPFILFAVLLLASVKWNVRHELTFCFWFCFQRKLKKRNAYFVSFSERTFTTFFARATQTPIAKGGTCRWTWMAKWAPRKYLTVMNRDFISLSKHWRITRRMVAKKVKPLLTH